MVIFAALFIVIITILFGAFGQRIQEFLQENALGTLLTLLSGINGRLTESTEAEEDLEPLEPSSSSPTTGGSEFAVFISFRGEDTRKGFTGHLYDDLEQRGVSTFIDSKKLEKGEEIGKLFEYIEKSKIFVPIFSERYAESKWCLKEVTKSLECGQEIVPVFFGVEPSDVGNQTGLFKSAFRKHESNKQLNGEEVRKWREALKKVGKISGFNLKDMNGDEAKLRRAVIKRVLEKVNKKPLQVAKHPTGIETRVHDVKKVLENGGNVNGVQEVGIQGMGGLGKTTIAKAIYNDLAEGFNGATCFLSNVRENAGQHNGLVNLQKQLIRGIFKEKDISLSDVAEGQNLIKERASRIRVLLILDDIDSVAQLDALAGGRDWFGSGSVIIITTRDEQVLLIHGLKENEIYKPLELNEAQSRELFMFHAFHGEQPQGEYVELSNEVVEAAGGLPLTLEVVGSLLSSKTNVQAWKDMLEKLKKIPDSRVQQRLKLSYDSLDDSEKNIFLDISCFFIGWGRENPTYMWEDCGWFPKYALNVLERRSLLKIDRESGEFEMHDQIRDMGRAIVEEECSRRPEKQSRLWNSQQCLDLLRRKVPATIHAEGIQFWSDRKRLLTEKDPASGTIDAEPIYLQPDGKRYKYEKDCVSAECFENMPNLRYLDATDVNFQGTSQCFPPSLKMLELWDCHFDPMPSDFNLEKVVVLKLQNTNMAQVLINQLPLKVFEKLKVLSIQKVEINVIPDLTNIPCLVELEVADCSKLTRIDESIGKLKNLTDLTLCKNEILGEIPDSIGEMSSLKKLDIRGTSIVKIPDSICQLSSLEMLDLEGCRSLTSFPERLGDMRSLEKLDLSYTSIIQIPDSIGQLTNLRILSMTCCGRLSRLPDSICQLSSLEMLELEGCRSLTSLPERLGDMRSLEDLSLFDSGIIKIPDSIGQLTNLSQLPMSGCKRLSRLPDSICQLSSLEVLDLKGCCELFSVPESLGDMKSLKKLDLSWTRIDVIPDAICKLSKLESLDLQGCDDLCFLPERLGDMEKLKKLILDYTRIEVIPDSVGRLKNLHFLSLAGCKSLKTLPDSMSTLSSLQTFNMSRTTLNSFENYISLFTGINIQLTCSSSLLLGLCDQSRRALKHLHLNDAAIEELPDCVGAMENLEELQLECDMLKELPNWIGRYSEKLTQLKVRSKHLKTLPDCIGSLKQLKRLTLKCENLKDLPTSIGLLENVRALKLNCMNLEGLPDSIGGLTNIFSLRIISAKLKALPSSIALLKMVERLHLECPNLEKLPDSFGELGSLEYIVPDDLKFQTKNVGFLPMIKSLRLNCLNLESLPDSMSTLQKLEVFTLHCDQFSVPPDFIGRLKNLGSFAFKSKNLKQLHATIFGSLWRLTDLSLEGCENLEDLTGFAHLLSLHSLDLTDCKRLKFIPQLPSSLRWFDASRCTNLRTMSDVSDLKTLTTLSLGGCKMLEDVPGLENISSNLQWLELPGPCDFMGCCHLSHDFKNKVFKKKETTFSGMVGFAMSGSVVRGSTIGKQQLHFMLPKFPFMLWRRAWLKLWLDKVVPPIHVLIMADDTTVFEKTLEVIEGNEVELNLRAESFMDTGEGEKEHCYTIQVTVDVSQLEDAALVLQQRRKWSW